VTILLPALLVGVTLGFLCGLLTFKRTLRWCRRCGETLTCPRCVPAQNGRFG
jgi:hypothetical protein